MQMVGHAAVNRATQAVSKKSVCEDLSKLVVEDRFQPPGLTGFDGHRPMNICLAAIKFRWKTLQVVVLFIRRICGIHRHCSTPPRQGAEVVRLSAGGPLRGACSSLC